MNFHHRSPRKNSWSAIISAAGVVLFATLAGCSSHPKDPTAGWTPEKLFAEAKSEAEDGNYDKAAKLYEQVEGRGAGTLLYLIAQQVHSFSSIVMPNEDTSFLVTSESLSSWGVGWMGGG